MIRILYIELHKQWGSAVYEIQWNLYFSLFIFVQCRVCILVSICSCCNNFTCNDLALKKKVPCLLAVKHWKPAVVRCCCIWLNWQSCSSSSVHMSSCWLCKVRVAWFFDLVYKQSVVLCVEDLGREIWVSHSPVFLYVMLWCWVCTHDTPSHPRVESC
jgi:hypothetical protein